MTRNIDGSPHGSFTILPTLLPTLPVSVVHLPVIGADESLEKMAHFIELYEATVLLATYSTVKRVAEAGKMLPKLRLVLYSGACFSASPSPINTSVFPNAVVRPSEFASMAAGLIGIPAQGSNEKDVFKVLAPLVVLEIMGSDGRVVTEHGVRGKVVITHLVRKLQPLVRFPTGDFAEWVDYGAETFKVLE
jgi:phenylacetate-CoA ligase